MIHSCNMTIHDLQRLMVKYYVFVSSICRHAQRCTSQGTADMMDEHRLQSCFIGCCCLPPGCKAMQSCFRKLKLQHLGNNDLHTVVG